MATMIDTLMQEHQLIADNENTMMQSIQTHVEYLLNTRQGSVQHIPDLGLPDLSTIYQDLPHSSHELMAEIKQCLDKFEPRLSQIRVYQQDVDDQDSVLNLLIEAKVTGSQQARFITLFANDGHAEVGVKH